MAITANDEEGEAEEDKNKVTSVTNIHTNNSDDDKETRNLTAREPIPTLSWEVQDNVMGNVEKLTSLKRPSSSRELCKLLKLHRRQTRMCRRGKGMAETLIKATRLSVLECQHQFKFERWNCSLGQYRQNILQKGSPGCLVAGEQERDV
nr:hypothetical protein BaRGS_024672 [Batillaria attramentaria]